MVHPAAVSLASGGGRGEPPPPSAALGAERPQTLSSSAPPFRPGAEPISGYRLLEPIGQGGFGEVWRCQAPGGLDKAIKFVPGAGLVDSGSPESSPASQEFAALQRVKALRHPFLLSLERVEVVGGMLVVVMELADHSLHALYRSYREQGLPGIPRDELLGFLLEAAEALDWMNFEHGLQHLDVKPHNLFLVSGHVKVADFGLVGQLGTAAAGRPDGPDGHASRRGGVTPLYSPPELLRGTLSGNSDQYSLAVVYQELLTGTPPFWHENAYDLMMRHLSQEPNLRPLPEADRPVVARALAKIPTDRYPSCFEFVQALLGGRGPAPRRSGTWRRVLVGDRTTPRSGPAPAAATTAPLPPRSPSSLETASSQPAAAASASTIPSGRTDKGMPTAVTLPGYRFLSCLNQSPLGDLWRAEDAAGRPRRALCLLPFIRYDARLIDHLQALRDPSLAATEVHWSPAERLVVLTEWYEGTLRDRLEECQANGQAGIPREQLLPLLRSAAETLDALAARHGLQHLGLHPRNLLVDGQRLRIADFGLIPLVWLAAGQSAAALNGRYTAPELFESPSGKAADQYSLGLIYAEMLTGAHPRPNRPEPAGPRAVKGTLRGGGVRAFRPQRSGRGGKSDRREAVPRWARPDLDLLPAPERAVVARALADDPEMRFPSCVAFVEALEEAGREPLAPKARYDELLPVLPFAALKGDRDVPDGVLPSVVELVAALTAGPAAAGGVQRQVCQSNNLRFVIHPDGSREYRCPLQQPFPGARELKVEGLRDHWKARLAGQDGDHYQLLIDLPTPRTFWGRPAGPPRHLEVDIRFSPGGAACGLTEARVRVSYRGPDPDQQERLLATMAPALFETARDYFQARADQRSRERVPLNLPLHLYPVLPDLRFLPALEGSCKDLSQSGIRLRLPQKLPTDYFYLHFYQAPAALAHAVLARQVRAVEIDGGWEVGAVFAQPTIAQPWARP